MSEDEEGFVKSAEDPYESEGAIVEVIEPEILFTTEDLKGIRRKIAEVISQTGDTTLFDQTTGKSMSYYRFLATQIWSLVVEGELIFADGKHMAIEDIDQWMNALKFLAGHIDGPVKDTSVGVNIYKVYVGVDENRV